MQGEYEGGIDTDILLCKLLHRELVFTTVERQELHTLSQKQRDEGKIYLLGDSNFGRPQPSEVVMSGVTTKALGLVGDEQLSTVAREVSPPTVRGRSRI